MIVLKCHVQKFLRIAISAPEFVAESLIEFLIFTHDVGYVVKTKNLKRVILATILALVAVAIPSAFAIESFPNWYTHQAVPNGSADGGERKATSNTNGNNGVYAESNEAYESRTASAKNNYKSNPYVTDNPTLTTSSRTVGYAADIDFKGDITYGWGSLAWYGGGPELLKRSGSSWYLANRCHHIVVGGDSYDESLTKKCTFTTNAGTTDFRVGGSHKASAFNYFGGVDTIVDFHTPSSGYYANTERLEMCEGSC